MGWESLSKRRWFRRLVQLFKILEDPSTPEYLKSPVPPFRVRTGATRSGNVIPPLVAKTNYYQESFYPDAIRCWNNLDSTLRNSTSLGVFKSNILKIIRQPKRSIFNIHDPKGLKRLFQLRLGLSPLRYHKKRHGFRDTPNDTCMCQITAETTEHFLLHCNIHNEPRAKS